MKDKNVITIFILFVLIWNCSSTRLAKPLKKGSTVIGGEIGTSVVSSSFVGVPLPNFIFFMAHGVSDKTTVYSDLSFMIIYGIAVLCEIGIVHEVFNSDKQRPGLSISPHVSVLGGLGLSVGPYLETRVYRWAILNPGFDINLFWTINDRSYIYTGLMSDVYGINGAPQGLNAARYTYLLGPVVGISAIAGKHWLFNLEAYVNFPYQNNAPLGSKPKFRALYTNPGINASVAYLY